MNIRTCLIAGGFALAGLCAASAALAQPTCNDRIRQNCTPATPTASTAPTQADYQYCIAHTSVLSPDFKKCIAIANAIVIDVGVTNGQTDMIKATWSDNGTVVHQATLYAGQSETHRFPRSHAVHIKVERYTIGLKWVTDSYCETTYDQPDVAKADIKLVKPQVAYSSEPSNSNGVAMCQTALTRDR